MDSGTCTGTARDLSYIYLSVMNYFLNAINDVTYMPNLI